MIEHYYVFEHSEANNHEPRLIKVCDTKQEANAIALERASQLIREGFIITGTFLPEIMSIHFNDEKHCISVSSGFAENITPIP